MQLGAEMDDGLHVSRQGVDTLLTVDYWRRVCPELHVSDELFQAATNRKRAAKVVDSEHCADVRSRLVEEGYAALPPSAVRWSIDVPKLAAAAQRLHALGWPPTFLAMYDEAWVMALDAAGVMAEATGNYLCMDIVGFHVDPAKTKGFSPHRDRQPEDWAPRGVSPDVSATFKADGMAKYVTLWAALTDATPDSSCLHFVPRQHDPGYTAGDSEELLEEELLEDGDPMQLCFPTKDSFQNIRSAPVDQGGCTFHTHRTIHWGSSGRPSYRGPPRIALSFGFSTEDFEPPYFKAKNLPFPSLALRLALCAGQVINYATLSIGDENGWIALAGGLAQCSASKINMLHKLFRREGKSFHPTYKKEIARKFVSVSMDRLGSGVAGGSTPAGQAKKGAAALTATAAAAAPDSDDDDDALEAMLQAEAAHGDVLFRDDFDLLNAPDSDDLEQLRDFDRPKKRRKRKLGAPDEGPAKGGPRPKARKGKRLRVGS